MALDNARAGQLPSPKNVYDQEQFRQLIRVLDIYFSQLDSNMPNHAEKYTADEFVGLLFTTVTMAAARAAIDVIVSQDITTGALTAHSIRAISAIVDALNVREVAADTLMAGNVYANFLHGDGRFVVTPFNMFTSSATQTPASTSLAFPLTLNGVLDVNSITLVAGSRIRFGEAGIYSVQYTVQFSSTDPQLQFADVWLRKNGIDIAASNSRYPIISRAGLINGRGTGVQGFIVRANPGDYVELVWHATALTLEIQARPAIAASGFSPAIPSSPSVIVVVRLLGAEFPPVVRVVPTSVSAYGSMGSVTVSTPRRSRR